MHRSQATGRTQGVWVAPSFAFLILALVKLLNPTIPETLELRWLDEVLRFRAAERKPLAGVQGSNLAIQNSPWGFAKPLDEQIRFVEINMTDRHAEQVAERGEFAVMADIIESLASLGPKVIAIDVLYAFGRRSDQELLGTTFQAIQGRGRTKIILPMEWNAADSKIRRSLPAMGEIDIPSGLVNIDIDNDHLWRHYRYFRIDEGKLVPSLALATYTALLPEGVPWTESTGVPPQVQWSALDARGEVVQRRIDDRPILPNFQHSYFNDRYDQASGLGKRVWTLEQIEELVRNRPEFSPLEDAIVFVGYGADFDAKPMAHGPMEPGMYLHATAVHDLIHQTYLQRNSLPIDLLLLASIGLMAMILFRWIVKKRSLLAMALFGLVVIGVAGGCSIYWAMWVPASVASTGIWGLSFLFELVRRWSHEERERIQRDAMLGFSFSPAVLKQVMSNREMIQPRGGNIAILLSDLRGFTRICESVEPPKVFELLNRLFGIETEEALQRHGSLRPFAGDQFLAYWGAPEPCENPADRALETALAIVRRLEVQKARADSDEIDALLQIGVGLHYGPCLVGHVGTRRYRDYNILGDLVNVAARIESQTKKYHAKILATREFLEALSRRPDAVLLDSVRVSGRSAPLSLYGMTDGKGATWDREASIYAEAFEHYRQGEFELASVGWKELLSSQEPMFAQSSRILHERCTQFSLQRPQQWQGIFDLTEK